MGAIIVQGSDIFSISLYYRGVFRSYVCKMVKKTPPERMILQLVDFNLRHFRPFQALFLSRFRHAQDKAHRSRRRRYDASPPFEE
jgi:hypothetical protein